MTKTKKPVATQPAVDYPNRKEATALMQRRTFLTLLGGCGAAVIGAGCSKTSDPPVDRLPGKMPMPSRLEPDTAETQTSDPTPPEPPPIMPTAGVPRRPDPNPEPEPKPDTGTDAPVSASPAVKAPLTEEDEPHPVKGRMRMPHTK